MSIYPSDASGLHHAGVHVADMERSLRFYRDLLELEVLSDVLLTEPFVFEIAGLEAEAIRIVNLGVPGRDTLIVELLEYQGIERHPASARPCDPGSGHLCLEVTDIDAVNRRLRGAGHTARADAPTEIPGVRAKALYAADPDGYSIEFFQRPAASAA